MAEELNTNNDQPNTEQPVNKAFTQEEVDKLIQAEADRRVNQARSKWEKETSKKMTEAERLGKMSEEDRLRYSLEQKEKELAAKEREFTLRDNKIAAMKVLSDKDIPADLVDFVVAEDAEVMNSNINKLERHIKAAVAAQVKAKLASSTPKVGLQPTGELTPESFEKMSYSQKMEIYTNNRDLYNKLSGK